MAMPSSPPPRCIGIVSRGRPDDILAVKKLSDFISERGVEVLIGEDTARKLNVKGTKIEDMDDANLIICVGGDGTILRTLHFLRQSIPILGVNMGGLGFLTEVQPSDVFGVLEKILAGNYEVEEEERLSVSISTKERIPFAMNEAVVITSKPGKMLHFAILINGEEFERLRADGVIFATPTGSTAYAMSAGGPIVDTSVKAMIVVPIAPFKLSARPLVLDIEKKVSVELLSEKDALLVIDGQFYRNIATNEHIEITRGEPALFVRVRPHLLKVKEKLWQD
ncbi:MAG: NAD(+)/NADH kinase [Candidatus Methanospirare jalkutatii]|nr:NAD(+)/NADH kinase [Candidatus Methanospirare jalkutatii]